MIRRNGIVGQGGMPRLLNFPVKLLKGGGMWFTMPDKQGDTTYYIADETSGKVLHYVYKYSELRKAIRWCRPRFRTLPGRVQGLTCPRAEDWKYMYGEVVTSGGRNMYYHKCTIISNEKFTDCNFNACNLIGGYYLGCNINNSTINKHHCFPVEMDETLLKTTHHYEHKVVITLGGKVCCFGPLHSLLGSLCFDTAKLVGSARLIKSMLGDQWWMEHHGTIRSICLSCLRYAPLYNDRQYGESIL